MTIEKIDIPGIAVLEPEDDAPVGANRGPSGRLSACEPQSGTVQVFDGTGAVEQRQDRADAFQYIGWQLPPVIVLEEPFQALVSEALEWARSVGDAADLGSLQTAA